MATHLFFSMILLHYSLFLSKKMNFFYSEEESKKIRAHFFQMFFHHLRPSKILAGEGETNNYMNQGGRRRDQGH